MSSNSENSILSMQSVSR